MQKICDLIVEAGGTPIATVDDLARAVDDAGETITLRIVRGTDERTVEVSLEPAPSETDDG